MTKKFRLDHLACLTYLHYKFVFSYIQNVSAIIVLVRELNTKQKA